jgi:hypothetical protein
VPRSANAHVIDGPFAVWLKTKAIVYGEKLGLRAKRQVKNRLDRRPGTEAQDSARKVNEGLSALDPYPT